MRSPAAVDHAALDALAQVVADLAASLAGTLRVLDGLETRLVALGHQIAENHLALLFVMHNITQEEDAVGTTHLIDAYVAQRATFLTSLRAHTASTQEPVHGESLHAATSRPAGPAADHDEARLPRPASDCADPPP